MSEETKIESKYKYRIKVVPPQSVLSEKQTKRRAAYKGPVVEKNGKVSVVMLSCKRLNLLQQTCESLFAHIDKYEQGTDFEYILVDNGSGKELLDYAKSLRFDKIIANKENKGIGGGYNQGFSAATGEFIWMMEDDWLCETDAPFVQSVIEVLREFEDIGIVRLKKKEMTGLTARNLGEVRTASNGRKVTPWFQTRMPCGAYCFGGGILKRQSFLYTGPIPIGVCHPRAVEHAYAREFEKYYNGAKVEGSEGVLVHIGGEQHSPGWRDGV